MKRVTIIVTIIILLIASFFVVAKFGLKKETKTSEEVEQVSVEGVGPVGGEGAFSGVGTLADLQKKGEDLECQIVLEKAGGEKVEGTYFTSRGNLRGDFMVPAPEFGGQVLSSMIVGGDSMYVWSKIGDDTFGFKSDIKSGEAKKVDSKEPVALDASVKYSCQKWQNVDGSVFVPPANVKFQDLNAVIEAGMEYGIPSEGEF
jgi:hypothetical protein